MSLLLNEPPLVIQPGLATLMGLNEAIVVQQLHYWLQHSRNRREGHYWVYNTYEDWRRQFPFWSERTLRRIIKNLEDKQIIITTSKFNAKGFDKTKWYRIDYSLLSQLTATSVQNEQTSTDSSPRMDKMTRPSGQSGQRMRPRWTEDAAKVDRPIPETTTETTTETTSIDRSIDPPVPHACTIAEDEDRLIERKGKTETVKNKQATYEPPEDDHEYLQSLADEAGVPIEAMAEAFRILQAQYKRDPNKQIQNLKGWLFKTARGQNGVQHAKKLSVKKALDPDAVNYDDEEMIVRRMIRAATRGQ